MTKSKGIGRGGSRKDAGRPRFAETGKTSNFSTRLTPKTRALLDGEAHRRGKSVSEVAEDLLQLGLEEMAAIRNPRPLKSLLFLVEMLTRRIPDAFAYHLDDDDSYSWQSNPYMFAAFRAAVITILDVLRPRGEIVTPPAGPPLHDDEVGELQYTFPDSPDEYGRFCARDLLNSARLSSQEEEPGFKDELGLRSTREPRSARIHYGLADAWEGLNRALQQRGRK